MAALKGKPAPTKENETEDAIADPLADIESQAVERIKDRVSELDWDDMQQLVAGILRAMGYKTQVSPAGSDRGKDIVASRAVHHACTQKRGVRSIGGMHFTARTSRHAA